MTAYLYFDFLRFLGIAHYKANFRAKKVFKKQKGSRAPDTNFDTVPPVPPQKIALAQLLFAYTNTYSSKTPLCHVCHVLFLNRKKNNCSKISLIVAQKSVVFMQHLPYFCHIINFV
jgi:hypothetical protein